jgi:hypothetical protein
MSRPRIWNREPCPACNAAPSLSRKRSFRRLPPKLQAIPPK